MVCFFVSTFTLQRFSISDGEPNSSPAPFRFPVGAACRCQRQDQRRATLLGDFVTIFFRRQKGRNRKVGTSDGRVWKLSVFYFFWKSDVVMVLWWFFFSVLRHYRIRWNGPGTATSFALEFWKKPPRRKAEDLTKDPEVRALLHKSHAEVATRQGKFTADWISDECWSILYVYSGEDRCGRCE